MPHDFQSVFGILRIPSGYNHICSGRITHTWKPPPPGAASLDTAIQQALN